MIDIKNLLKSNKDKLEPAFEVKNKVMSLNPINRFLTIGLSIFVVYMTFFDDDNFIRRIRLWHEINRLQSEVKRYESEINDSKTELEKLQMHKETLEKYAREEYLMKKENEDIFIIEE